MNLTANIKINCIHLLENYWTSWYEVLYLNTIPDILKNSMESKDEKWKSLTSDTLGRLGERAKKQMALKQVAKVAKAGIHAFDTNGETLSQDEGQVREVTEAT